MIPKRNYYLNDYFDMFNMPLNKEYMKTDIYELDNKYYLEIDLPGIKKENIKINYENGYLTISAEKNVLSSGPNTYIRRERFYGEIKRSFYIGIKKDTDLKAKYFNGILTITFPKADIPKKETKNITIS
jgi:HSP20 family protein